MKLAVLLVILISGLFVSTGKGTGKNDFAMNLNDSLCLILKKTSIILEKNNYFRDSTINTVLEKLPFKVRDVYYEERWARTSATNIVVFEADDIYKDRAIVKNVAKPSLRLISVYYYPGINIDTLKALVMQSKLRLTDTLRAFINKHKIDHVELSFNNCE